MNIPPHIRKFIILIYWNGSSSILIRVIYTQKQRDNIRERKWKKERLSDRKRKKERKKELMNEQINKLVKSKRQNERNTKMHTSKGMNKILDKWIRNKKDK